MRNQDDHSAEQSANILLLTEVQSCNNYRAKHADRIFLKYIELQNALEQNDLQEVQRLSNEMMEHCREIAIDSEVICDTVIERLSLLSLPNRSDKKNIRLPKSIIQVSAERANKKYSDWADIASIHDDPVLPSPAPSAFVALEEETNTKAAGAEGTAEVVISEQKVPDNDESSPSVASEEDATTRAVVADCSASNDNEKTDKRWFGKLSWGRSWRQGTSSSPASKSNADEDESVVDRATTEVEDVSSSETIENSEAEVATDDVSEGAVGMDGAIVSEVSGDTATAAVTSLEDHLKVDMDSFNQLINVLANTETNALVAAPDLPIRHLVQSLVGLSFKIHKDLYQNLQLVTFQFLSVLSPLSKLNKVFGAFLRAEATEMESVVDLRQSGLGSIAFYFDKKTSEGEAENDSEGVPDDVYKIKKAIYRAYRGNNDDDGNEEELRSLINDKVKNSHVKRHVTMSHATNNLLMHVLNLYFVVAILSELSILEAFQHLSKETSLIESVKGFARRVNPEVAFNEEMKTIVYLFTYVAPALEKEELVDDAWMVTCSILCNLNKIWAVGPSASPEARKNDKRQKKLVLLFRALECQTISGTDTSAVEIWSGTDEACSVRRLKAIRTFAVHFLRLPIEESLSIDYFNKFGFTHSFLFISPSSIRRDCTFITPKAFSKCQDSIPKKMDKMMKNLAQKDSTGKLTIFIESAEQRNSLKLLLDAYEKLTQDSHGNSAV